MKRQETPTPDDERITRRTKQVDTFELLDVLAASEHGPFEWLLDRQFTVGDTR